MLSYLGGPNFPLAFRRGWTHGVLALVLLPPLLTAALVGFDRLAERMRSAVLPTSVRPRELLLLSSIAVWSHPVLDTLNVYGVRWLMPFAERWFYGDVLFIIDPWLTLVLAAGVWVSRRRARARHVFRTAQEQPARLALGVVVVYIALMTLASVAGSRIASRELTSMTGETTTRVMLAPVPVNPFSRRVVAEQEQGYLVADFRWLASPHIERASVRRFPRGPWSSDAVQAASRDPDVQHWLTWARFPTVRVDDSPAGATVHFMDIRYAEAPGARFGSISVPAFAGSPP